MIGCDGAMGRTITEFVKTQEDINYKRRILTVKGYSCEYPVYNNFDDVDPDIFDIAVDFSHFSLFDSIANFAQRCKKPIIIATTGLSEENVATLKKLSKDFSVFLTKNLSYGVNLMLDLIAKASCNTSGYDIEIIEKHHNKKVDAPSGTALMIANTIKNNINRPVEFLYGRYGKDTKRKEQEITIHAVRGGTIPGDHTVIFAGPDEIIEISHSALSKKVFAAGAIKAARFICDKKNGFYDMTSILKS
jgi:4-hydroxy-tetrahydrodipicolinate reductase